MVAAEQDATWAVLPPSPARRDFALCPLRRGDTGRDDSHMVSAGVRATW